MMEQQPADLTGPMSTTPYEDYDPLSTFLADQYYFSNERFLYPLLQYNESTFIPEAFVPPQIVIDAHLQPRFGRPNILNGVIDGNKEQTRDYVTGVVIGSVIIASVAIVWFIAIICLKCAGSKRVGFLSGRFVRPYATSSSTESETKGHGVEVVLEGEKENDDDNQHDDDDDDDQQAENNINEPQQEPTNRNYSDASAQLADPVGKKNFEMRVGIVRVIFLLSGIAVIISGGLFYGKGAASFRIALDDVQRGIDMVQVIGENAISLADNVTMAADDVENQVKPDIGEEPICGLDSELSTQIRSLYNALTKNVKELKSVLDENIGSISDDVRNVLNMIDDVESYLEWSDIFFTVLIVITVVIISLIVAMMVGVFFAWKGVSNSFTKCIQYALVWPLFIFSLVLSWIFSTLFLAAGLAGADFCVDPDKYVEDFLYAHKDMFSGILFGFLVYYVTGCKVVPPGMTYIVEAGAELKTVMTLTHELTSVIADLPISSILVLCDLTVEQATVLKQITTLGHTLVHILDRTMVGLRNVISCGTMNPIYTIFVHEALCKQAVAGMSWIFYTTLFIAIFSMVLIMTRAALYPIQDRDVLKSSSDDEVEVVKYVEQPQDRELEDKDARPFESVPASVYDRVSNADSPSRVDANPDAEIEGAAESGDAYSGE